MEDVVIIGAGVLGCFIARDLAKYKLKVRVIEKEDDVCNVASSANSAIIHSGYDPLPRTQKAYFNVRGNAMYDAIAKELDVPFYRIGSLTLAFSKEEYEELKKLEQRAKQNGVMVRLIEKEELLKMESHLSNDVYGALEAPTCGIINPFLLCAHLMENALDHGVQLSLREEVVGIEAVSDRFLVKTNRKTYETKVLINAAGVHAYDVTSFLEKPNYQVTPRKGEYFVLDHFQDDFVSHVLFTLPSKKGKGVLISPTTSFNYLVGPSSEPSEQEDTSTDLETLKEVEKQARRMIPSLPLHETIRVFSGVRPTINLHEFYIHESENYPRFLELAGIESPGLASAPMISKKVVSWVRKKIRLTRKKEYTPYIRSYVKMSHLSIEERNKRIHENPRYGRIICRCENVSEQEIRDLFHRSFIPTTIKAIKKRVRTGFGKCQGSMCQPFLVQIMKEELSMKIEDIRYDGENSNMIKATVGGENPWKKNS